MKQRHRPGKLVKRTLDLSGAGLALLLAAPVMALAALAVRLSSPGPALFRQLRLGLHGKPFWLLKFRSMYVAAPDVRNPDGSAFSAEDDARVTSVGRWLRKTSLDELPQLFNVLRGEMSLVGPRPDPPHALAHYRPQDHARLSVKPGITGWAAVNGRNRIPWEQRRDLDLEYVTRRSFWFDLKILALTVPYALRCGDTVQAAPEAVQGAKEQL
jgi:lipopolysaccharide/colanic/teichoic acid biosynthesis glycosyltransferase